MGDDVNKERVDDGKTRFKKFAATLAIWKAAVWEGASMPKIGIARAVSGYSG